MKFIRKYTIGRSDLADFPELQIEDIPIKIDTGAYTSSIYCHDIHVDDGQLYFRLLGGQHPVAENRQFVVDQFEQKQVKNSFGISEERFIVQTTILLFNEIYPIELSLSNRENMRFPVLIGRKLLEHFIVDVTKTNLSKQFKDENRNLISQ